MALRRLSTDHDQGACASLLGADEKEDNTADAASPAARTHVAAWTNVDVIKWCLDVDQKGFIPAIIANNISGATLCQLTKKDIEGLSKTQNQVTHAQHSVQSFWNHIEQLAKDSSQAEPEIWGTDENKTETYGRLLSHPTGWTYDREYNEWVDFVELHNETAISDRVEMNLRTWQDAVQVIVLVLSAVVTLGTTSSFAKRVGKTEDSTESAVWLQTSILVFSFFTTIVSGYVQIRGGRWKEQLTMIDNFQKYAGKLEALYEENLTVPLRDRLPFDEYSKRVKALWSCMPTRLDITPAQRNSAIRGIKDNDPTVWKRGFQFLETGGRSCCSSEITLSEPMDDRYDAMLMRFSGEDMGEYTTTDGMFKKDKQEAKKALIQVLRDTGDISAADAMASA